MSLVFDSVTCTRCGGSGKFSYCSVMNGPFGRYTCFKCFGEGQTLTKKGDAAQAYYNTLLTVKISDVQVGQKWLARGIPGFMADAWITITSITPDELNAGRILISGIDEKRNNESHGYNGTPDDVLRIRQTAEEVKAKRAQALAYQETLTKTGTPRKRAASAA